MDILGTILIILACLVVEAFFSGSEIAVVSADRMKLRHAAASGSRGAKLALSMLEKPEWLLSTTLVGTNIAVVTNTTLATALAIHWLGEGFGWVAVVAVTPLIWIFGEIVAKSAFQQRADVVTPRAVFVLRFASFLFWPILWIFALLTRALGRSTGGADVENPFTLREEIRMLVDMSPTEGDMHPEERSMIRRVFNFTEITAGEIMVPLIDVVGIERDSNCREAIRIAVDSLHKRLPVYDKRVDRIVGTIDALDLLLEDAEATIDAFVQPVRYVAATKSIEELLVEFVSGDVTVIVVDEFGGSEGIVMLEDILEEVVGELGDEFDEEAADQSMIRQVSRNQFIVAARASIDTVNEALGTNLPDGDYETLGGFLISLTGEIPVSGEAVNYQGVTFTVLRATEQAVQEVSVVVGRAI
jgi:CBS domain containing-hemolysin-like protein